MIKINTNKIIIPNTTDESGVYSRIKSYPNINAPIKTATTTAAAAIQIEIDKI